MRNNLSKLVDQAWVVLTDYATYDFQDYELPENHGFNPDLLQAGIDADDIDIDASTVLNAFPQSFDLGPAFEADDDYFDDDAVSEVAQATLDAYVGANPRLAAWLEFKELADCVRDITTDDVVANLRGILHLDERDAAKLLCYALDNGLLDIIPDGNEAETDEQFARTLFERWVASKQA